MIGWVFFRADTLSYAGSFLAAMVGLGQGEGLEFHAGLYINLKVMLMIAAGVIGAMPLFAWMDHARGRALEGLGNRARMLCEGSFHFSAITGLAIVFVGSAMALSSATYNPFIYFRF